MSVFSRCALLFDGREKPGLLPVLLQKIREPLQPEGAHSRQARHEPHQPRLSGLRENYEEPKLSAGAHVPPQEAAAEDGRVG